MKARYSYPVYSAINDGLIGRNFYVKEVGSVEEAFAECEGSDVSL